MSETPFWAPTIIFDIDREHKVVQGLLVYAMSLHIVSWNVNGFHASGTCGLRKLILRHELQSAVIGRLDMLPLQEHKLSEAHASRRGKVLLGCSHTY